MNNFQRIAVAIVVMFAPQAWGEEIVRGSGFVLHRTAEGVDVTENGKPVLFYQSAPKQLEGNTPRRRAHYVHPVCDLSGNVITEDFPKDHLHHRGIFWAWHQVMVGEKSIGDPWICQAFDWDVHNVEISVVDQTANIKASAVWSSPDLTDADAKALPIARDDVEIRIHPREPHTRAIDFTIRLTALVPDLRIGGSDDTKGYGGFSTRMRMPDDLKFISESGPIEPAKNAIAAAHWMKFHSKEFSYAVFNSAHNPGDPRQWILRQNRSMQNPVYPGRKPVALKQDRPTVLRYRVVILEGGDRDYDLPKMSAQFQATLTNK